MKPLFSTFFEHVYEKYLAKAKKSKHLSSIDKLVDIVFLEREFIDWLRIKYEKRFSEKSYPKYCTDKNFESF